MIILFISPWNIGFSGLDLRFEYRLLVADGRREWQYLLLLNGRNINLLVPINHSSPPDYVLITKYPLIESLHELRFCVIFGGSFIPLDYT